MKKKVNYHRILSEALGGMKWDTKNFVVHHINHNRDDNTLLNLVLIPKNLHKRYHLLIRLASSYSNDILKKETKYIPISHLNVMMRLIDCKNDMSLIHQEQCFAINSIQNLGYSREILEIYNTNTRETIMKYL